MALNRILLIYFSFYYSIPVTASRYLMFSTTSAILVGIIFGINAGVMVGAIQGSITIV